MRHHAARSAWRARGSNPQYNRPTRQRVSHTTTQTDPGIYGIRRKNYGSARSALPRAAPLRNSLRNSQLVSAPDTSGHATWCRCRCRCGRGWRGCGRCECVARAASNDRCAWQRRIDRGKAAQRNSRRRLLPRVRDHHVRTIYARESRVDGAQTRAPQYTPHCALLAHSASAAPRALTRFFSPPPPLFPFKEPRNTVPSRTGISSP